VAEPEAGHPPAMTVGEPVSSWQHKRSWAYLALLMLAMIVAGSVALATDYNPSQGARGDFEHYHFLTIELFRHLPWSQFLHDMRTASGPLFYALVGSAPLGAGGVRAAVLMMHVVSSTLLVLLALRQQLSTRAAAVLGVAFFASPFQLGPALWGHPETLGTLMMLAAIGLNRRGVQSLAPWLLPLSVAVRQTSVALVGASVLTDLKLHRFGAAATKLTLTLPVIAALAWAWGGLTPPAFHQNLMPSTRSLLASLTLLTLGLCAWDRSDARTSRDYLRVCLLLFPLIALLYNLCGPFRDGGFVFSRLDSMEARWLSLNLISPLLMAMALSWCWRSLRGDPLMSAQILVCAVVSGASNLFYVKYADYFFWPLLLMRLIQTDHMGPAHASEPETLVRAALAWTSASLVLVTLWYRQ